MDRSDAALDFDAAALDAYLRTALHSGSGPLVLRRTAGGMSNPTYTLRRGDWQAVLRKRPAGPVMPSAHAIDREWRVLGALHGGAVPVPAPLHYCADATVIGTPFYLMEWLHGRVITAYAAPGLARDERAAVYEAMVATLAAIHRLDPAAIGLADHGRPGPYYERQLKRWSAQWAQFRRGDDDNPALDRLVAWLQAQQPPRAPLALCHGDYRIGNLMFHAAEPRVIGVLDWELSTLGDPLADLAYNLQAWRLAGDENGGLLGQPLAALGIPDEDAYLERYVSLSGATERLGIFHRAFAMFRGAVGSAGVAARGAAGNAVLPDAERQGHRLSRAYAGRAMQMIEQETGNR